MMSFCHCVYARSHDGLGIGLSVLTSSLISLDPELLDNLVDVFHFQLVVSRDGSERDLVSCLPELETRNKMDQPV